MRKVVLYIACSLDGFIAKPNDDVSFLSLVEKEGEDYGYAEFTSSADTVLMGRKTFDWVYKQIGATPHPEKETYIITSTPQESIGLTQFYTGDVCELVQKLKQQEGGVIYCDGGAQLANYLLAHSLINEMIISVIPVMLQEGVRLFNGKQPELPLQLLSAKQFSTGLVQLHYVVPHL